MKLRQNLVLILIVLLVGIGLHLGSKLFSPGSAASVRITRDGEEVALLQLGGYLRYVLEGEDGSQNVIVVDGQDVYMESASCRDQLCVGQGRVNLENCASRALGTDIICLPNRVVVSLVSDEIDPNIPDV